MESKPATAAKGDEQAAVPAASHRPARSSPPPSAGAALPGLLAFAGLLGAILVWTLHLRRRRSAAADLRPGEPVR
jgi:hypothetical protein